MATVAHTIRSAYDPEEDRGRLLAETGQDVTADADAGRPSASADSWESGGLSTKPRRYPIAPAPRFVPASVNYDGWAYTDNVQGSAATPSPDQPENSVASWYKSLKRRRTTDNDSRTAATSPQLPPYPSNMTVRATSSTSSPPTPHRSRHKNDSWFIAQLLNQSEPAPPETSLADILTREPPSRTSPLRPPTFLHLGPSNRGWVMMQSQGWSEGEVLGATRPKSASTPSSEHPRAAQQIRDDRKYPEVGFRREEVELADDPEIIEVKHVPLIDLTIDSDVEDQDEEEPCSVGTLSDGSQKPDDDVDASDGQSHQNDGDMEQTEDPRSAQRALITPLATVLKSDRLGIGLKAKTSEPHRASVKRITHNAAALDEHTRSQEESRRKREKFGRGHRGLTRVELAERQERQDMYKYLNS